MEKQKNKKAFTLIELLVVISIIGLMSSFAVIALSNARSKAKDVKIMSDLKTIATAFEKYYVDWGEYPASSGDCTSPADNIIYNNSYICENKTFRRGSTVYMTALPKSPNNFKYQYIKSGGKAYLMGYLNNNPYDFLCTSGSCKGSPDIIIETLCGSYTSSNTCNASGSGCCWDNICKVAGSCQTIVTGCAAIKDKQACTITQGCIWYDIGGVKPVCKDAIQEGEVIIKP